MEQAELVERCVDRLLGVDITFKAIEYGESQSDSHPSPNSIRHPSPNGMRHPRNNKIDIKVLFEQHSHLLSCDCLGEKRHIRIKLPSGDDMTLWGFIDSIGALEVGETSSCYEVSIIKTGGYVKINGK